MSDRGGPMSGRKKSKPAGPAAPSSSEETPGWIVLLTFVGAAVLLTAGILVLLAGWHTWEHPGSPQVGHPTKATFEVVRKPVKVVRRHGEMHRKFSAVKRVKTVERASQSGGRSETVALATLATGAALLLAGGFAARLTSLELPGVKMSTKSAYNAGVKAGTEVGSVAGARVATVAKESGNTDILEDKEKLARATKITLREGVEEGTMTAAAVAAMAAETAPPLEAIDDQKLQEAAEAAVKEVSDTEV